MKASIASSKISPALPYILPFALFMLITYLGPLLGVPLGVPQGVPLGVIYPVKTILVGASLVWFWKYFKSEIRVEMDWVAVLVGVGVFVVWVGMEGWYPQLGEAGSQASGAEAVYGNVLFLAVRLAGAVLLVPVMEEVFWRSFALRFLIDTDFKKIPLGKFTWFSFILVSLAFGLEHHRWLPGILAGVAYAGVLYRSRNLFSPILAHAITNLLLGFYVIMTESWLYW